MMCLDITCPRCACEDLTKVTGSAPDEHVLKAILKCADCRHEFAIAIVLFESPQHHGGIDPIDTPSKCGTDWGYRQHRLNGEPYCDACTEAHRVEARKYYKPRGVAA